MDLEVSDILSANYKSIDQEGNELSTVDSRAVPMNGATRKGGNSLPDGWRWICLWLYK